MRALLRPILVLLGSLSLALGVIGIFIPVLPTTPFLLFASFCYVRSSKKLYDWLLHHKVFGAYLYNYTVHRAVPKKTKIIAMVTNNMEDRSELLLFLIGCIVSAHLLRLRTLTKEDLRVRPPIAIGEEEAS